MLGTIPFVPICFQEGDIDTPIQFLSASEFSENSFFLIPFTCTICTRINIRYTQQMQNMIRFLPFKSWHSIQYQKIFFIL